MQLFSLLGNEEFYLLVMPLFYWCIDARIGLRLGLLLLISNGIVDILKLSFHTPRPYWYEPHVQALTTEGSFALPSGHAQNSVAVWGGLAVSLRKWWVWVVGIILLLTYLALESPVTQWLNAQSFLSQILAALVFSLLIALVALLARSALEGYTVPAAWIQAAMEAAPETETIVPVALSGSFSTAGALFSMALGAIWLRRAGGYEAQGTLTEWVIRFFIGLLGVALIWWALGMFLPRGEFLLAYVLRYLRYALTGVWITGIAPLVFIKIRLARTARWTSG